MTARTRFGAGFTTRLRAKSPSYFGFEGAKKRFLHYFPGGFQSNGYAADERNYKLKAKDKLDQSVPLEEAAEGAGFGEAALAAFRATNLLSPFEQTRMQEVLRSGDADAFIRGAARFAQGDIEQGLAQMEKPLRKHDNAKWTIVTYLPFLWRPESQMFLKPTVTKDFAERVGHSFAHIYSPRLEPPVYESLLDLAERTDQEIADLGPRDRIDTQSFIWVIGAYDEGNEPAEN